MNLTRVAVATGALLTLASPVHGQGTCTVEMLKPFQLQSAAVYLQRHDANPKDLEERAKNLKQAVRVLTDKPARIKNEPGRNMLLVMAYVRWFSDQGTTPVYKAKRSDLGFAENPDGEFLLPQAVDEALTIIEREVPACADSTARYQMAFISRLESAAVAAYNAKSYDAALENGQYALVLKPRGAQAATAFQVLASAYHAKNDALNAIVFYERFFGALEPSAANASQRAEIAFNIAALTRDQASPLEGDARAAGYKKAIEWFEKTIELEPEGPRAGTSKGAAAKLTLELTGGVKPPV